MPEWLNGAVSKTVELFFEFPGFESLSLRKTKMSGQILGIIYFPRVENLFSKAKGINNETIASDCRTFLF